MTAMWYNKALQINSPSSAGNTLGRDTTKEIVMPTKPTTQSGICPVCGESFTYAATYSRVYCSRSCANRDRAVSPSERFWKFVDKSTDCWIWMSVINKRTGYGQFWWPGRAVCLAHRAAYEITYGAIPEGMIVLHACDTRNCVNPAHLRLGTHEENMQDMVDRGRSSSGDRNPSRRFPERQVKCDTHPAARLTWKSVRDARMRHENGERGADLARELGVSRSQMSKILLGESWREQS